MHLPMQPKLALSIAAEFGTPVYVYSEDLLKKAAKEALAFQAPFGLTVRYAMKANPHPQILRLFAEMGIKIDASSGYEASRCLELGIPGRDILLTSQELPKNLKTLVEAGVQFNACSLHQLKQYGMLFPGKEVSLRINPGEGSGFNQHVNVGGKQSSFGIWHESIPEAQALIKQYGLTVKRLHTHIGSGTDPDVWASVAAFSLSFLNAFPSAEIFNMGGGFKVARIPSEKAANMAVIGERVSAALLTFEAETGRKIQLEIEPGTFLVAKAGALLCSIQDKCSTGKDGYTFLKLNAGMTEIIRPSYYGAQHSIQIFQKNPCEETESVVVVGHCCESADLLTPHPEHPEEALPRLLPKAEIGDLLLIEDTGAYCSSMSTVGYNSFPKAAEIFI